MQNTRKCLFSTKIIQSILCWYVHKHNRTIEIQILDLLVLVDEDCLFLEEIYAQKYTASAYRHIPSAEQTPIRIIQSFTWSWLQNNKQRRSGRAEGSSSLLEAVLGCHWETRLLHPLPPSPSHRSFPPHDSAELSKWWSCFHDTKPLIWSIHINSLGLWSQCTIPYLFYSF